MASVRARRRQTTVRRSRQEVVLDTLTAAGIRPSGMLPTLDVGWHGLALQHYYDAVLESGHTEVTSAGWPCEAELTDVGTVLYREPGQGVYRLEDGTVVHVRLGDTWISINIAAGRRDRAANVMAAFQAQYPPLYLSRDDEDGVVVPVTFWMLGSFGPERRLRRIASTTWADVEQNYTAEVQAELARLTGPDFTPGETGQLLLWYGPPGTGKTWAVRALADAWASWAEFHVITDPDAFFVRDASYMVDVLLHESYEAVDEPTGVLVTTDPGEKWRVLILEDTGELLSADAKDTQGQGLSRLLNVVDGMIGQGLRILVLVTTNDEIETLHPAVQRPGRCASKLIFGPLSAEEASAWCGETVDQPMTLAELYARDGEPAFGPDPDEPADLEAELDPLTQAAVDAASAPLPDLEAPDALEASAIVADVAATLREHHAAGHMTEGQFAAALEAIAHAHLTTADAVRDLVASAIPADRGNASDLIALSAIAAIERMAARPAPTPAPMDVHVHVPERELTVNVAGAHVEPHLHVPEQAAPIVNVQPAATQVDVHVPAAEPAAAPTVHVHVPEQAAAPAPDVHVHVPAPQPRTVRVVEDPETGERSYVAESADGA